MSKQIGFNKPTGGGISPCVTSHYHKVSPRNIFGGFKEQAFIVFKMDKVIQIANICKDMCNVPNPIPGRIYYAKGCAPALNTCGGGWRKPMFLWIRPK